MKKIILILITVLVTACNISSSPEQNNGITESTTIEDYFPIKENTKYSYEGKGNEFATYTEFVDYVANNRIQTRTNNGGTESVKVMEIKDGELLLLYHRGETYFRYNFLEEEYNNGKILLKEPLEEGNSWDYDENTTAKITHISKEVVTHLGNFNAIEVTLEGEQGKTVNYYAKDMGLIKTITSGEGYEVSSTLSSIEKNVPLMQTIKLYYPDTDGIHLNTIDVPIEFYTNEEPEYIVEKNIKDLSVYEIISPNTKINQIAFNEEEKSVHVDLSEDFVTEMNAGAGFEGMILQSLTNTLGNYYGVEKVYITIDGGPYESGHIIIEEGEPSLVNYDNVKEE
ncbi:MAG TPA: GerMN domain-containing protein [Tissierellia bacterium]|nr:GerMN domain-containing protein [Tissierellia bacterium]